MNQNIILLYIKYTKQISLGSIGIMKLSLPPAKNGTPISPTKWSVKVWVVQDLD